MSASLSCRLALRRSDGDLVTLPRFRAADNPLTIRAHLLAFYELRDAARLDRAALAGVPGAMRQRLALAAALDEIEVSIEVARQCLKTIAKRGGRGVPAPERSVNPALPEWERGAGAEPLRSAAMDGCASAPGALPPASAVGPATKQLQAHDITNPDHPFFVASGMQELPPGETPVNNQNLGERNHGE